MRVPASDAEPAPDAPLTRPSRWVWRLGTFGVRVFYRVERAGHDLPEGPLLLVANHPNALIDPALVQATAGRLVRFLAKSTLFAGHPLSPLIRRSGAIPVYRRIDPGVDTSRNVQTFAAVTTALARGEAICLFPEGISHAHGRLEPLRTGAARMVLETGSRGTRVTIVPIGLNFERFSRFRSRVQAVFGRPFDGDDLRVLHETDPAAAVRELTGRIEARLRRLMVEAEPRRELHLVERADRLYAAARGAPPDPHARVERRRLIADGMGTLRERDPEKLAEVIARVNLYDASLRWFGLRDRDIDREIPFAAAVRFAVREGLLALLLGPVAAATLVVFAAPYWVTGWVARRAPDPQVRPTWQLTGGAVIYLAWIATVAGAAAVWGGGAAVGLLTAVGMIALAVGGLRAVERESSVFRAVRMWLALRQTPREARAWLRSERAALAELLDELRAWIHRPRGG